MFRTRDVFLFIVTLVIAPFAQAAECESYQSPMLGHPVRYCLQRSRPEIPQRENEPVAYFLHGIQGDATSWTSNGYAEALSILSREENFPPFTVVSFDTSATSFFSDPVSFHPGKNSYETWFITEFMPMIERKKSLCHVRACRVISGLSMGGFGALKIALRHSELFSAAAANSAALPAFNFQEPNRSFIAYFSRHPIGVARGMAQLSIARKIFTTRRHSDENDPSFLVEHFQDRRAFPRIYLDVGGKDYFGFQEGFWRMIHAMETKQLPFFSYFEPNADHDLFRERRWFLVRFIADNFRRGTFKR